MSQKMRHVGVHRTRERAGRDDRGQLDGSFGARIGFGHPMLTQISRSHV
jgi:hypothetical protein